MTYNVFGGTLNLAQSINDILPPQVRSGVPSRVTLLHSCAEVRAVIELSFKMVSGVTQAFMC